MSALTNSTDFGVEELRSLYQPDMERLALGARRQEAVWRGEIPDAWPLLVNAPLTSEQERIPAPDYKQAFRDPFLMLCSQMRGACACANSGSDAVPSIRSNLGTGICMSLIGLKQTVFSDKMPWLLQHLSLEEAGKLTPDDIRIQGDFETGLEHMRFFREAMGDAVPVYCMDTQGPFDLAHLMVGDEIFYAVHDDPPLVHHIMEIALEIGIRAHAWMKEVSGEATSEIWHGNGLRSDNMGVRICEDTTAIVGPDIMEEFALPYSERLAERFGGAWIHYCGRNDELTKRILRMDAVRGINFGHIPGHDHDHPFEVDMENVAAAGKVYYGSWPRRDGESGRQYLDRMHEWASRGALLTRGEGALLGPDGFDSVSEALDYWYSL